MFGIKIKLRNQAFLSVDNWGKLRKTVVLVSVVKKGIFTSGARAREFYFYDQGQEIMRKLMSDLPNAYDVSKFKGKISFSTSHFLNYVKKERIAGDGIRFTINIPNEHLKKLVRP